MAAYLIEELAHLREGAIHSRQNAECDVLVIEHGNLSRRSEMRNVPEAGVAGDRGEHVRTDGTEKDVYFSANVVVEGDERADCRRTLCVDKVDCCAMLPAAIQLAFGFARLLHNRTHGCHNGWHNLLQ